MKRKRIYLVIAILVLIISITAVSFALWNSQFTQSSANVINTGCLELKLTNDSNAISLSNQYPISDTAGKKFVGYTFTVSNTCTIAAAYNISLDFKTGSSYFTTSQIKAYVSGDQTVEPKLLNSFNSSSVLSSGYNSSRLILSDEILPVASSENTTKSSKTYTLRVWIDENVTTSDGTNKTFDGKLTISAVSAKNNILAQRVLKDNIVHTETPDFTYGEPGNAPTTGTGFYKANDDDGTSYYFRGNDINIYRNNVSFAGRKWKIVRINGDGTVRLILDASIGLTPYNNYGGNYNIKYVGYTYDNDHICTSDNPCTNTTGGNSTIKTFIENWYNNKLKSYDSYIALSRYCNDTSYSTISGSDYYYGASKRMADNQPSLKCPDTTENYGGSYKLKIGLLSVDEMMYAGLGYNNEAGSPNYLYKNVNWYSMSPCNSNASRFSVFDAHNGYVIDSTPTSAYNLYHYSVYPVINLNAKTTISGGDGTISNPYVVK